MKKSIKAKYLPKKKNYFTQLQHCIGEEYSFSYCYSIDNVKYYEPTDINFLSSTPVSENDLEIINDA